MTGRRWKVCKRDGIWAAIDHKGDIRYASDNWKMTYQFARLGYTPPTDLGGVISEQVRRQIIDRMFGPDQDEEQ